MSTGKRRSEAERAIIYAAVMGGLTNARVDQLLEQVGGRPLPPGSYEWVKRSYVPYFLGQLDRLGAAIEHPPTATHIKETLVHPHEDDDDL
ncbi:MAG: hypothetical protein HUU21_09570 [Polyangiaceae bacterium]|nr:hypothetical protein [Polyangiaceae bacterium]